MPPPSRRGPDGAGGPAGGDDHGLDPFDEDTPAARRARARRAARQGEEAAEEVPTRPPSTAPEDRPPRGRRSGVGSGRPARPAGGAARAGGRAGGVPAGGLAADRRLRLLAPLLLLLLLVVLLVRACGGESPQERRAAAARAEAARPQLPGGGRTLLPDRRVVTLTGAPQDEALGALGIGTLGDSSARLLRQARDYAEPGRPTTPALHLISTIAQADPGEGGRYSGRQEDGVIAEHLRVARRREALLILDLQPGRADFLTETRRLRRWLAEPDVMLALDPEWRMEREGQVPGQEIGSVGPEELQATFDEVDRIVRARDLPPKLVLVHRFTADMIRGAETVRVPDGVLPVMSIDGVGGRELKVAKHRQLVRLTPPGWGTAFKVFYEEDAEAGGAMSPREVLALRPRPDVVIYE